MSANFGAFNGFAPEAVRFLGDLRANNNKPWFEDHKDRYQLYLLRPFQALVAELAGFMLTIDPEFITVPAVNKTISRIYRDTRFSKDKSLFRSSIWLTFKRPSIDWKEAPAYFFEITPEWYRYGMGFYSASKVFMDRFRQAIREEPEVFRGVTAFYRGKQPFTLEGEVYKRLLAPDLTEDLQQWYQRKNLCLTVNRSPDSLLFSKALLAELLEGFSMIAPFYQFLWELKHRLEAEERAPSQIDFRIYD